MSGPLRRSRSKATTPTPYARPSVAKKGSTWSLRSIIGGLFGGGSPNEDDEMGMDDESGGGGGKEPLLPPPATDARPGPRFEKRPAVAAVATDPETSLPPTPLKLTANDSVPTLNFGVPTPARMPLPASPTNSVFSTASNHSKIDGVRAFLESKGDQPLNQIEREGILSMIAAAEAERRQGDEPFRFTSNSPMHSRASTPVNYFNFGQGSPADTNGSPSPNKQKGLSHNPNGSFRYTGAGSSRPRRNRYASPAFGTPSKKPSIFLNPTSSTTSREGWGSKRRRTSDFASSSTSSLAFPSVSTDNSPIKAHDPQAGPSPSSKFATPPPRSLGRESAPGPSPTRAKEAKGQVVSGSANSRFPTVTVPTSSAFTFTPPSSNGTSNPFGITTSGARITTSPTKTSVPPFPMGKNKNTAPARPSPLKNATTFTTPPSSVGSVGQLAADNEEFVRAEEAKQTESARYLDGLIKDMSPKPPKKEIVNPYQIGLPVSAAASNGKGKEKKAGEPRMKRKRVDAVIEKQQQKDEEAEEEKAMKKGKGEPSTQRMVEASVPKGSKRIRNPAAGTLSPPPPSTEEVAGRRRSPRLASPPPPTKTTKTSFSAFGVPPPSSTSASEKGKKKEKEPEVFEVLDDSDEEGEQVDQLAEEEEEESPKKKVKMNGDAFSGGLGFGNDKSSSAFSIGAGEKTSLAPGVPVFGDTAPKKESGLGMGKPSNFPSAPPVPALGGSAFGGSVFGGFGAEKSSGFGSSVKPEETKDGEREKASAKTKTNGTVEVPPSTSLFGNTAPSASSSSFSFGQPASSSPFAFGSGAGGAGEKKSDTSSPARPSLSFGFGSASGTAAGSPEKEKRDAGFSFGSSTSTSSSPAASSTNAFSSTSPAGSSTSTNLFASAADSGSGSAAGSGGGVGTTGKGLTFKPSLTNLPKEPSKLRYSFAPESTGGSASASGESTPDVSSTPVPATAPTNPLLAAPAPTSVPSAAKEPKEEVLTIPVSTLPTFVFNVRTSLPNGMKKEREDVLKLLAGELPTFDLSKPLKTAAVSSSSSAPAAAPAPVSGFNWAAAGLKPPATKKAGGWTCGTCMVSNKGGAEKCVSCEAPAPASSASVPSSAPAPATGGGGGFNWAAAGLKPKEASGWTCGTCMVPNKSEAGKCVACEGPAPA